ncbi:sigma 54-interacting transcriptional regulator [Clostridium rectalis]|uniref:sigma 54-interacting transcriptional regulator n=1 Tax=Clostridium rectalis TaxID=2040295 RepID=UPI000F63B6EE|nr:sigma 54-interacting transcriptional regulator [Clostridium rectalis]
MILRKTITIKHEKGLHARVSAMVVNKANEMEKKFNVRIYIICKNDFKIPATSIMMIIGSKIKKDEEIVVEVIGDEVAIPLEIMCTFLQGDFDIKSEKDINKIDNIINENTITLEHIIDSMVNGVIAVDENNIITVCNSSAEKMLDINIKNIIGKNIREIVPDTRLDIINKTRKAELTSKIKIGKYTVLANRTPIFINNHPKGAVAIFEDISMLEKITGEFFKVKELKEQLQLILESVQDGICVLNREGIINYVNSAYLRILNQQKDEIINKHIDKISPNGVRKKVLENGEKILGAIRHKDNGINVVSSVSPIIIDGEVQGVVSVVKKLTEIQELYEKLNKVSHKAEYLEDELLRTKKPDSSFKKFKGKSGNVLDALALATKAARSNATVLIRGESGTGKELIAEGIHYASQKSLGPFIRVNCASIPVNLIESELFGHEKGAFTGAVKRKLGKFELANNGTIFLDEIGELEKSLQAKILRVIQNREIQRVGGEDTLKVDVRIIAATHRNLELMIKKGEFREDLYYRLNVIPIILPPLRERKEDIPLLIEHFINKIKGNNKIEGINRQAINILINYNWPGNVRELENVIERVLALTDNKIISVEDLPLYIKENKQKQVYFEEEEDYKKESIINIIKEEEILPMREYEKIIIGKALEKYGSFNAAGKALGITHRTVAMKARQYGIEKVTLWRKNER